MPTFQYTARDIEGKLVNGSLTAADEQTLRRQLRRNNLFITRLDAQGASTARSEGITRGSVKLYDLVIFSRQLSTLVRAGLNLNEALQALGQQTRNPTLRLAVYEMQRDILQGSTFTDAMKRHPKIFAELYVSLVEAGELGGMLDQTLDQVAVALDKEMEIREKVKSAFVYPIAVLVTAVGVVGFLLMFVVPVFANIYKQFKQELPAITQFLVSLSAFMRNYWWVGVLAAILFSILWVQVYRNPRGRRILDALLIRLPLFGHLIEKIGLSRMSHTLASLMEAGVPLIRSLGTAGRVSGNSLVLDALADVSLQVHKGVAMGIAMVETRRFPLLMTKMISAGEESGNLGEMLEQVGIFFDREVDYGIKRLMTLMEPILTVFMGFIVGFILIALYYPIFNLGNVVK